MSARPRNLGEPHHFNDIVAMDSVKWTNAQGQNFCFITSSIPVLTSMLPFHVNNDPTPNSSLNCSPNTVHWIHWAGPPKMLLHDSAGEFRSEEFARYLRGYDIRSSTIPADTISSYPQAASDHHHSGCAFRPTFAWTGLVWSVDCLGYIRLLRNRHGSVSARLSWGKSPFEQNAPTCPGLPNWFP